MPEMEQNSQYEELPAGKSMKVSLPDGRALIVESGTSYPGAFIGVLDKKRFVPRPRWRRAVS